MPLKGLCEQECALLISYLEVWAARPAVGFGLSCRYANQGNRCSMAETKRGKKFVVVEPYSYKRDGKIVHVGKHDRSTPKTSKGPKK
jgi:hypothetical protein